MGKFWSRKEDPQNAEEFLIYKYKESEKQLAEAKKALNEAREAQLKDAFAYETAKSSLQSNIDSLQYRLKEVKEQATGVIDTHETVTIYKAIMWDRWDIKNYFPHKDDESRLAAVEKFSRMSKVTKIREAQNIAGTFHGKMLVINEIEAKILSVPNGNTRTRIAIGYPKLSKIVSMESADFNIDAWSAMPFDEFISNVTRELDERISDALKDLRKQAEKEKENDD